MGPATILLSRFHPYGSHYTASKPRSTFFSFEYLALAIVRGDRGNEGRLMYWPLIPSHEKSMKLTYSTMNAKVERLRESYTWRRLLQTRRCIIPVNGFYEFVGE